MNTAIQKHGDSITSLNATLAQKEDVEKQLADVQNHKSQLHEDKQGLYKDLEDAHGYTRELGDKLHGQQ